MKKDMYVNKRYPVKSLTFLILKSTFSPRKVHKYLVTIIAVLHDIDDDGRRKSGKPAVLYNLFSIFQKHCVQVISVNWIIQQNFKLPPSTKYKAL